jgi:hypothetical protein
MKISHVLAYLILIGIVLSPSQLAGGQTPIPQMNPNSAVEAASEIKENKEHCRFP